MLSDIDADGTPLDPQRDIEDAYHAASARHNQRNRDMWGNFLRNSMPRNEANVHRPETTIYTESSSQEPTVERSRKRRLEPTPKEILPAQKREVHPSKLAEDSRRKRRERDQEFYAGLPQPAPIQGRTKREISIHRTNDGRHGSGAKVHGTGHRKAKRPLGWTRTGFPGSSPTDATT